MKILLTAFDPFGGESTNPAQQAVEALCAPGGTEVDKLIVPTVFYESIERVKEAMSRKKYDAVVCVGQAGGRCDLTIERIAININDAAIPDNAGVQLTDTPVIPGGPDAYFATLPVKAMAESIRKGGIPASVSNTAGTFVCNHLLYGVLHEAAVSCPESRCGFIHVPYLPAQVLDKKDKPSMELSTIVRGIELALACLRDTL